MNVLVVDDEADHRQYLCEIIANSGHDVTEAADGDEALRIMAKTVVNVLITDLMMPRMDGFELLRKLGAEGRLPRRLS